MKTYHIPALIFMLLFSGSLAASAQSINMRRANDAMKDLDYMTAILLYQQVLQNNDVVEAKINLADCYRKINDTENAEIWYGQVVRLPKTKAIYWLYYGMMLQANGKCEQAKPWLDHYQKENPDDARGQALAKACDRKEELLNKNKDIYVLSKMPFNSNVDDYSPTISGKRLVFASDRDLGAMVQRTSMWTGNPFSELYSLHFDRSGPHPGTYLYGRPEKYSNTLNSKFNEAAVAFAPDSQTVYFTRNNYLEGKTGRSDEGLVKLKIYSGRRTESGEWADIQGLPFNSDEYNVAHPSISANGRRLYFSSNMPGGYGGMDLYVSEREEGRWGAPMNLGPVVNSEGNEIFPFITADNRLYFASNGQIGLGGLDIYYTTSAGKSDNWNLPVNLGFPINSSHDDFSITFGSDLSWGYFTSDREGGAGGDDIYGFQKSAAPVEIYVFDAQSKLPLSGVAVSGSQNKLVLTTGSDGKIAFDMRFAECADFSISKKGYEPVLKNACTSPAKTADITRVEIPLQKEAIFTLQGLVFDMTNGLPAEGASVMLMNDCNKPLPQALVTAGDGRFKFKLDKACCYTVRVVMDGYIADVSEPQCTKGLTLSHAFKANLNLEPYRDHEGFITSRPSGDPMPSYNELSGLYENTDGSPASYDLGAGLVVKEGVLFDNGAPSQPAKSDWQRGSAGFLVHLYYDFNQTAVSEASRSELQRLFRTLQDNPELSIEIASHTDARGASAYNLQLSQERADEGVNWLAQHGIARERLTGRGYGETQPVNRCSNDVPCSEQEHQLNRRTEFRVLGQGGASLSKPKQGVKVAPCAGCPF